MDEQNNKQAEAQGSPVAEAPKRRIQPVRVLLVLLAAAILVGVGVFCGLYLRERLIDPDLDPDAEDYPYQNEVTVQEGEIAVPGFSAMIFPKDRVSVQSVLVNPEENDCYFVYSFILMETGEELYRSGMIPPGMAVQEQTLSRPLAAGEYMLLVRVQTYSLEDKHEMNGVNMEVPLTVN
jgi:hypothetical protein